MIKLTNEQFKERATEKHKGKYDYSKAEYINANTKICIICLIHGEFWQVAGKHLGGYGCPKCGRTHTTEEFIIKAKLVHGDKYDYSLVKYTKNYIKICIICHEKDEYGIEHGEFWQTPNNHLKGQICLRCYRRVMSCSEDFIREAKLIHGDKHDYSLVDYKGMNTEVIISCLKHGEFIQTPHSHLNGCDCPKCSMFYVDTNIFIKRSIETHGNKYDYSKSIYINSTSKICIICPEHGDFWQMSNAHMDGANCPICASKNNISENKLLNLISNEFKEIEVIYQYRTKWLKRQSIDIFIPYFNIAIEYQGRQHFEPVELFGGESEYIKIIKRDKLKYKLCKDNNITLLYFTYEKKFESNEYIDKIYIEEIDIINKIKELIN